uniref:START domain-containing protein 1 n=1 Tax=Paralichthys olivaceus TaxID=8255 RepID=A0A171LHR8_PAROL|nr:steroidogenic acute regulatory protein isoform 2 [Paralichthys olivaceus]
MLPAVVKLCCGISYPHLRSTAGLQRTAMAVIGQEIAHLQRWGQMQPRMRTHAGLNYNESKREDAPAKDDQLFYVQQGRGAMRKALSMLEDKDGWKVEIRESNGDVICSKVMPGARKVFRLEAVLEAGVDELYDLLFTRVEEMHQWNPSIQHIKAEDGPTCIVIQPLDGDTRKSHFTWLLNMDVKGWLPKSIVNQALPRAQLDFTRHLRRRLTASATLG